MNFSELTTNKSNRWHKMILSIGKNSNHLIVWTDRYDEMSKNRLPGEQTRMVWESTRETKLSGHLSSGKLDNPM